MPDLVLAPVRRQFRALAVAIVPSAAGLDDAGSSEAEVIVERALASRPAKPGRQLALFVRLLTVAPLLRHGRRFPALDSASQARFLGATERAPLLLLRRGVWGLCTIMALADRVAEGIRRDAPSLLGFDAAPAATPVAMPAGSSPAASAGATPVRGA